MVTRTVQTQREFLIYTACSDIGQHARDDENHRQKTRRRGEQRLSSSRRGGINWRLLSATAVNCLKPCASMRTCPHFRIYFEREQTFL